VRIIQIEIEEFGKLRERNFSPTAGMNLFEGPNESGKSTLLAFLRFALYGFPRRSSADGGERDLRLSWQGRRAAGKLTLEVWGTLWRISRTYALRGTQKRPLATEELSVISLTDGTELSLGERTPGEYFLGLPPELYDGSLCVRQSDIARVSAPGMGTAVEQLLFGDESRGGTKDAERILESARRALQYRKGRGGKLAQFEDELAALDSALTNARTDALELEQVRHEAAQLRAQISARTAELRAVTAALENAGDVQTLADFEELHRAKARVLSARAALEQAEQIRDKSLPDTAFFDTVRALLHQCTHADDAIGRLSPEVTALRKAQTSETQAQAAAYVAEQGGDAAILARHQRDQARAKRCVHFGVIAAALTAIFAVLFAVFTDLRTAFAIATGASALATTGLLLGAWHARAAARKLCRKIGAANGAMLRTRLEQCRACAARGAQGAQRLQELELELQMAEQSKKNGLAALAEQLATAGHPPNAPTLAAMQQICEDLARTRASAQTAASAARAEYERALGVADALSARLAGRDEAAIRARATDVPRTEDPEALRETRDALTARIQALERTRAEAERRESVLSATAKDPVQLESERARVAAAHAAATQRLAALKLALTALEEAGNELRRNVTPTLAQRASGIFSALTRGAHGTLYLDADFAPTVDGAGGVLPLSHFSAGCRDAAHLALRLALLETLCEEKLPLFFDEALARLDDDRAHALLDVLQEYCRAGGQCLLFSCHSREAAWLGDEATVFTL